MSGISIGNNVVNGGDVPKLSSGDGSPKDDGNGNELYYDFTNSNLYGWDGSAWNLLGGGGSTPNLQQVTNVGSQTTNTVLIRSTTAEVEILPGGSVRASSGGGSAQLIGNNQSDQGGYLSLINSSGLMASLFADLLTSSQLFHFPDASGKLLAGDSGVVNLVNGVATVSAPYATSSSTAQITCKVASGTTIGGVYKAVCSAGSISISSLQLTGAIQTLDNSTVQWLLIA